MGSKPVGYSASRAAAILGLNKYQSPFEIWQKFMEEIEPGFNEKNNYPLPEFQESAAIRFGHAFEDAVILEAEREYNLKIIDREKFFEYNYKNIQVTCHVDGIYRARINDLKTLHEGKTTNVRGYYSVKDDLKRWGEPLTDQVPEEYQIQCNLQMLCTGADQVFLSVLVFPKTQDEYEKEGWEITRLGKKYFLSKKNKITCFSVDNWALVLNQQGFFHKYIIKKNPELENLILEKIKFFHDNYVLTKTPPPPIDYSDIKKLLTNKTGTAIATKELESLAFEYSEIARQLGSGSPLKKRQEQIKVKILDEIRKNNLVPDEESKDKIILISPSGGDILCSFKNGRFSSKRNK